MILHNNGICWIYVTLEAITNTLNAVWRDRIHLFGIQSRTESSLCRTSNSLIIQELNISWWKILLAAIAVSKELNRCLAYSGLPLFGVYVHINDVWYLYIILGVHLIISPLQTQPHAQHNHSLNAQNLLLTRTAVPFVFFFFLLIDFVFMWCP